ncbi:MAG: GHKL domain-containing protein [Firmicutes bacterium]|nr:GHKL domain-containing protein [Bacillota bacterium]
MISYASWVLSCGGTYVITWVSLRLLNIVIMRKRLLLFSLIHGVLVTLLQSRLALPHNFTFYESLTYVALALVLLRLPMVTVLMSRAIGLSLIILTRWLSLTRSPEYSFMNSTNPEQQTFAGDYMLVGWIASVLALVLLGLIIFRRLPSRHPSQEDYPDTTLDVEAIILGTGFLLMASYFGYRLLTLPIQQSGFLYLCISLVALPIVAIMYSRRLQTISRDRMLLELQQEQLAVQENAIEAMREQRHEIINELALVSSYIQMGMDDKALESVDFIAALLADRYNYVALPKDAWIATIRAKQQRASRLGIQLVTFIEAEAPTNLNEQRLLPKVVANLLDNAFEAVRHTVKPQVILLWKQVGHHRLLSVRNKGPVILPDELDRLFDYGYSSKPGQNKGWGLAICKRIAAELGGELHVVSNVKMTEFALLLPSKCQDHQAEAAASQEQA